MLATATVVEIDNRFTRQRFKLLIGKPRGRLLRDLREAVNQVDPETGDTIDACVLVDPWGAMARELQTRGLIKNFNVA